MDAEKIQRAQDKLYAVDNLSDDGLRDALRVLEPVRAARIATLRDDADRLPEFYTTANGEKKPFPGRVRIEDEIRLLENYPLA